MGIFRDITKTLKKAAPIIGAGIGMYFGGPMGASIGSGIGSLASGRSAEESLKNAALAGATTYAMGGKDFGKGFEFSTAGSPFRSPVTTSVADGNPVTSIAESGSSNGIIDMIKNNPKTALAIAGTGIAGLSGIDDEVYAASKEERPYAVGKSRLGYGKIGDKLYNLDDEEELKRYQRDNRNRTIYSAAGGEVNGPGTGTSDSVPARLSDGEFVVTAQAVRGAGGGDRDVGAARMYDMMSQLEGAA
jgi:hypothetical protein|tara:strand:- start:465 stop:1202 length:738 start_codon:yes stop_codon:yes gene_type:complete